MITWRVLPWEVGEAGGLLGRSLELLDGLASDPTPTLRWYESSTPAVVLGRGQGQLILATGVDVVTRFSGGGAVLLDADVLSLDVLVPTGHLLLGGDMTAVFPRVGQAWARALRGLGVPDVTVWEGPSTARRRGNQRDRLLAAICYATIGCGEVCSGGRKLVGLAQRRRRPGALVQCGLLWRWRPASLLRALGADPEDAEIARHATGLHDLLRHPPGHQQVTQAVERELSVA